MGKETFEARKSMEFQKVLELCFTLTVEPKSSDFCGINASEVRYSQTENSGFG